MCVSPYTYALCHNNEEQKKGVFRKYNTHTHTHTHRDDDDDEEVNNNNNNNNDDDDKTTTTKQQRQQQHSLECRRTSSRTDRCAGTTSMSSRTSNRILYPDDEMASKETLQYRCDRAPEMFLVATEGNEDEIIGYACGTCVNENETLTAETMGKSHDPNGTILLHSLRRGESIQTKTRPRRETPPRVPGILESSKQRPKTRKQIGTEILSAAVQKTLDSVLLRHRRVYALRRKRRDARQRSVVRLRVRVLNAAAARARVVGRLTRVDTHFCVSSRIETNNNACYLSSSRKQQHHQHSKNYARAARASGP